MFIKFVLYCYDRMLVEACGLAERNIFLKRPTFTKLPTQSWFFLFFFVLLLSAGCSRSKDEPSTTPRGDTAKPKNTTAKPEEITPADITAKPEKTKPADTTAKFEDTKKPLELCSSPKSLKQAVLQELKNLAQKSKAESAGSSAQADSPAQADAPAIDCNSVTTEDLAKIQNLKITNIRSKEAQSEKYDISLSNLQSLDLSDNKEMAILPNFVYSLTSLKKLNISNTGISNLSGDICRLENLEELKASHNSYEGQEAPIAIFCLNNLKVLDLSHSRLRYIDEYIFYLENLERLYLQGNELMTLPVVFAVMSQILVLDVRDNIFEHTPANFLYDCSKTAKDSEERQECQKNIKRKAGCEYWHKFPFERGQSFRDRFSQMTGEPHKTRRECVECNSCYRFWIDHYVSYGAVDDPRPVLQDELAFKPGAEREAYLDRKRKYLLDLTINGKTMREWRLALDELYKLQPRDQFLPPSHVWCEYESKGLGGRNGWMSTAYHLFLPRNTEYLPQGGAVHPERHFLDSYDQPKKCKPIDYTVPIPASYEGPWSKNLSVVEDVIKATHPYIKSCKDWPSSFCPDERRKMYE